MAKETIQEAYAKGVLELKELENLARKSPKNGQVRRDLSNEITELRKKLIYVKQYLVKNEELQADADEQWKKVVIARERASAIERNLSDYYNLKLNFGDSPDLELLKQEIVNNLKFIKAEENRDNSEKNKNNDIEISEKEFDILALKALNDASKATEKYNEIVGELNKLKTDTLENPIWVDENRPEADRERILSEKRSQLDAEEQIQSSGEKQETLLDEADGLNSGESHEESLEDIEKELKRTAEFKKLVAEKEDRYTRITNLKGSKLIKNSLNKTINKSIRSLQKEIANREKFIKNFVYDFSQNPNYEVSDELRALIGSKDGADKNTVMQRPTVKQHLEPILKIEEELKNGVSPEREKELKAEKEKREKRLGKKWLLKLKIDKVNSRIQELTQLLSGDLSPEDKEKYQKELSALKEDLISLQKEYGEVLVEIGEHISNAVEKSANERKAKIKSADKDKPKVDPIKPQDKPLKDDLKQPQDKPQKDDKSKNDGGTAKPQTDINGTGSQRQTSDIPTGGNIANSTNISSNLPMVKKETWLDKLKAKFAKEEEPTKTKVEPKVIASFDVGDDISAKQVEIRQAGKYPMVNGKYFYHTISEGDELKYVREPLENIPCTRKELVNKIKEVQEKYGAYYKGLYEEQKGNPLFSNPNIIASKLIGFSNGLEKRQRILKAMCSLESSIHPSEAIKALNGEETIVFRPGINGKGEFTEMKSDNYLDEGDILAQYAGKVRYKGNEKLREDAKKVKKFLEWQAKLEKATQEILNDESIDYQNEMEEVNKIVSLEDINKKIAEYQENGIDVDDNATNIIIFSEMVKRSEEARTKETKADEIRANLGAPVQEANVAEFDNTKNPSARRRGRVEPIDYASDETRNRRNREGKPRASDFSNRSDFTNRRSSRRKIRNFTSVYDDKNAPKIPRMRGRSENRNDDVIEK